MTSYLLASPNLKMARPHKTGWQQMMHLLKQMQHVSVLFGCRAYNETKGLCNTCIWVHICSLCKGVHATFLLFVQIVVIWPWCPSVYLAASVCKRKTVM